MTSTHYTNAYKKKGFIFKSRPGFEEMPNRSIITNIIDYETCTNEIKTSKYTVFNFVPKNLFYQFSKVANLYFLMIGVMQMIPEISISGGMPVIFMPLSLVIIVSAIKDIFEDLKRKASDTELNNMQAHVLTSQGYVLMPWSELRIGMVVKVKQNQQIPIDMILLQSSEEKRNCYIQTKNLDGETNLKFKNIQFDLGVHFENKSDMQTLRERVEFFYERPNPYIYTFSGKCTINDKTIGLDNNNIALRGCTLRITKYITGVAVYSGYDTKIMLNSNKTRQKKSRLEFKMGIIVAVIFFTQMGLTLMSALLSASWSSNFLSLHDYLNNNNVKFLYKNEIFTKWGSWILLFTNFVPISLIVSLEMVKFIQGIYISKFRFNTQKDSEIAVQSSNLNEELGQIQHFFSDKTGTLTCNYMSFKYMVVDGMTYGGDEGKIDKSDFPEVTNVEFNDIDFMNKIRKNTLDERVAEYIVCLALCHSVIVQQDLEGNIKYNASSPDELAFINFAKFCGYQYKGMNKANEHVIVWRGQELRYKQLHVIEFNSDRKRMSVILQKDNRIFLYCKGADNKIIQRLKEPASPVVEETSKKLEEFSVVGLRTLLFAKKQIKRQFYEKWSQLYVNALTKLETKQEVEKNKMKEEMELKKVKKKKTLLENIGIDKMGGMLKLQNIGKAIIEAEEDKTEEDQRLQEDLPDLTDNLILTSHQKIFIKQHREQALETHMTASELEEAIQKDMLLIGASAIEDKLQDNVKETIQSLRKAGIMVWMLTGDKKETAINIGYSCGLIDEDMAKLVFMNTVAETVQERSKYNRQVCLVITGDQLLATQNEDPKEMLALIKMCKSVIACRVTPKQKQELVALLRKSKHTTCAIGDGANDVNMINMAHVGIGIKGVEGAQAAQCSDYAISEFQMVSELLLYHGRESYRKNSRLILFNFYKNMILVLPQFWFGMKNGFSSASMFDPWIYQLYNVVYTSLPIIIYAIFDEEFSPAYSTLNPQLYKPGITNQNFNLLECLKWFISPAIQAFLIEQLTFEIYEGNVTQNGHMMYFASTGMVIFAISVIICNFKVLLISYEYSIGSVGSAFLSILLFYITYYWAQLVFYDSSIANTLENQLSCPTYYAVIFAVCGLTIVSQLALIRWSRLASMDSHLPKSLPKDIELPLISKRSQGQDALSEY